MPRPPALCQGCGHRDVYDALNKVAAEYPGARIFGDIGCYTLGALPPFRAIDSCVDMGASITMRMQAFFLLFLLSVTLLLLIRA